MYGQVKMAVLQQINSSESRRAMIEGQLRPHGVVSLGILNAFLAIPREHFTPNNKKELAYSDQTLVFDREHILFSPYITARLLEKAVISFPCKKVCVLFGAKGYTASLLMCLDARVTAVDTPHYLDKMRGIFEEGDHVTLLSLDNEDILDLHKNNFDLVFIERAITHVPDFIMSILKPGGRIATIIQKPHEVMGRATVFQKEGKYLSEIYQFDAHCPLVPLYQQKYKFNFND